MLHTRQLLMAVEAISSNEDVYTVLFDFSEGNSKHWNAHTWDEYQTFDEIEIVGVYREFANKLQHGPNLYHLLSDDEEDYLKDLLFAMRENERDY